MSLYHRIMGQMPNDLTNNSDQFYNGFSEASRNAAEIAKEADDLINWCHAHFETLRQLADSAASFDEANIAIDRIKKYKESTK